MLEVELELVLDVEREVDPVAALALSSLTSYVMDIVVEQEVVLALQAGRFAYFTMLVFLYINMFRVES